MPTEVTFNNKSIKDTNISVNDFNKVKDNIEEYSHKLMDMSHIELNKSIYDVVRMFVIMFVAIGLLPLSIILTLITACDYDKED